MADSDAFAGFAVVAVHLLLMGLCALPVLVRPTSGATTYGTLRGACFKANRRLHVEDLREVGPTDTAWTSRW
ncbi:hypothetical protein M2164_004136 [Streptomyces sp. SAI-208]|nr:hypothetical protein [Streptomyces sp. SAI-208]